MSRPDRPTRRMSGQATTAPGRGSTLRLVVDTPDAGIPCSVPLRNSHCMLRRHHDGAHLPYPELWPTFLADAMRRHPAGKGIA